MRKVINDHPAIVLAALVLSFTAATYPYWWPGGDEADNATGPQAFFYDLNTKELFVAPEGPGPIETESGSYEGGPAGVRAHVFACGRCIDKKNRYIAYLSKPNPDASDEAEALFIKRPHDHDWISMNSAEGNRIVSEAYQQCKNTQVNRCNPGHGY